ncbi:MAG: DUF2252 family protein [Fulvimarina manganoxydans]|uniref:DUF2252 family protein n=1 Tax=Fulvimarina manganoxydans TaxID=937218 RepID=UPI0023578EDD|nr:DUF2252 family protein [Fulvimarina manganoxydans]MCK5932848.1 DUF2252 family protein [Fulvimarina manganoxydans]
MDETETERRELIAAELHRVDGDHPAKGERTRKHSKMASDPFRFLRGSAQLFYKDLYTGVLSLPAPFIEAVKLTGIMGDCHLANFGFVTEKGSGGGLIVFAPNDFDDACLGHAGWDLCRYVVSLFLAVDYAHGILDGRYISEEIEDSSGLVAPNEAESRDAAAAFVASYRDALQAIIDEPQRRRTVLSDFPKGHILCKALKKARKRAIGGKNFETKSKLGKAVEVDGGQMRFRDRPDRFRRLDAASEAEIRKAFRPYVDDEIIDLVERIGQGTGSVNVERYYLLVGPKGASTVAELPMCHLVELKQQRHAAPLAFFGDLDPRNSMEPAHLTVDLQRLMQREPDLLLDDVTWKGSQWLVRSRHHASVSLDPEEICLHDEKPGKRLKQYAEACGEALAYAHSRIDHRSTRFEAAHVMAIDEAGEALIESAEAYAHRVIDDWSILRSMRDEDQAA